MRAPSKARATRSLFARLPDWAILLVFCLLFISIISAFEWNIGHRHLLLIYPFLFILVSALVPWATMCFALTSSPLPGTIAISATNL